MPPQETAFLFDEAVVWEYAGVDKDGEPTVLTPYEIKVRWESGPNTRGVDQTGQLVRFDAFIICQEEYPLGSIFWLGKYEDLATPPVDLFRAVSFDDTADIRNITTYREYGLLRFHNTLPEIVGTS